MNAKRAPESFAAVSKSRPSRAPTSTWSFTSKSNVRGRAPAAHFDVFRFVAADRHAFVRNVRDAQKQVFKVRADAVQFLFEVGELFGDAGGFGHQRRSVLTRLLRHADLLGERVALRLELFGAGLHGLALRLRRLNSSSGNWKPRAASQATTSGSCLRSIVTSSICNPS